MTRPWTALAEFASIKFVLAILLCTTTATAGEMPYDEGLLWRIERDGVRPSYVFGIIPTTDPRAVELPGPVVAALEEVDTYAATVLVSRDVFVRMYQSMFFLDGRRLDQIVGPELFSRAAQILEPNGIREAVLRNIKPWGAALLIAVSPDERRRAKNSKTQALSTVLQRRAYRTGKKVSNLSTVEEYVLQYESLPEELQIALLKEYVVTQDALMDNTRRRIELYLAGKTGDAFAHITNFEIIDDDLRNTLIKILVYDMTAMIVERNKSPLSDGAVLVAISIDFLPGEDGIMDRLVKLGYTVTRVY
jgi:uncharacterized protein YbaP (TraB family)